MMRLYSACGTRRLTSTTMVFCILVETTWPIFSFLIPGWACCSAMLLLLLRQGRALGPLAQNGVDASAVLFYGADFLQSVHLPHGHLKLQTKQLLVYFTQLAIQLVGVQVANFVCLHIPYSASSRLTNLVLIDSLWAASRMAACAVVRSTPSISNRIFPGRITATHCSGAPLPLPMRVSAGFLVIGLSGNSRIHTLPPRLIDRVMATRAASIWRSVIQAHSMALRPYSPKAMLDPRQALPAIRPRCCFLYLTFFGIIMAVCLE